MSDTSTKKTTKENTVIQEVWVTHWDLSDWGPHLESVSLRPWETDYTALITKFADNTRFVNADHAQAEKEAAIAAEREACERVANAAKTRNTIYEKARRDAAEAIRARTPADARAALDARDKRVREDALREAAVICNQSYGGSIGDVHKTILALIDQTAGEKKDD